MKHASVRRRDSKVDSAKPLSPPLWPHTNPAHKSHTRIPHTNPAHESRTRIPHTNPAHESRTRIPHTNSAHESRTLIPHTHSAPKYGQLTYYTSCCGLSSSFSSSSLG